MKAEFIRYTNHYDSSNNKEYYKTADGHIIVSLHQSNVNHFQKRYTCNLYIDSLVRVKIITNYCSSYEAYNEFGKMGKQLGIWNNIQLVYEGDYDYLVIINKPQQEVDFVKSKTIIFQMEPWCDGNNEWGVNTQISGYPYKQYLAVIGEKHKHIIMFYN